MAFCKLFGNCRASQVSIACYSAEVPQTCVIRGGGWHGQHLEKVVILAVSETLAKHRQPARARQTTRPARPTLPPPLYFTVSACQVDTCPVQYLVFNNFLTLDFVRIPKPRPIGELIQLLRFRRWQVISHHFTC